MKILLKYIHISGKIRETTNFAVVSRAGYTSGNKHLQFSFSVLLRFRRREMAVLG